MAKRSALKKGKRLQAFIGLLLLIPPVLGVIFFIISVFGGGGRVTQLENLQPHWLADWSFSDGGGGGGMSAAPIYLGLMALAGSYLLKDTLQCFFKDDE